MIKLFLPTFWIRYSILLYRSLLYTFQLVNREKSTEDTKTSRIIPVIVSPPHQCSWRSNRSHQRTDEIWADSHSKTTENWLHVQRRRQRIIGTSEQHSSTSDIVSTHKVHARCTASISVRKKIVCAGHADRLLLRYSMQSADWRLRMGRYTNFPDEHIEHSLIPKT